jgi:excinuclease ABC subunit A
LLSFTEASVIDPERSLEDGAVLPWGQDSYYHFVLMGACKHHKIPVDIVYNKLKKEHKELVLNGSDQRLSLSTPQMQKPWNAKYPGIIPYLNRVYHDPETSESLHEKIAPFVIATTCPTCHGYRVGEQARHVLINEKHIGQAAELSVEASVVFFESLQLNSEDTKVATNMVKNIRDRLKFLKGVGLGYMTLSRRSNTLSGGESQRIRLATQVGTKLEGITYVLDEPSIGLHPRDSRLLIDNLRELVNLGNTVIVVEHDEEVMRQSDHIIDIGPGAGVHGGNIIFE